MAKGKPDLGDMLPESARAFAEGGAVDAVSPVAKPPTKSRAKRMAGGTKPPAKRAVVAKPMPTSSKDSEPKRQTAIRLTPSTVSRINALAGKKAMQTGQRVTMQDVMEAAIFEYLKKYE